MGRCIVKFGDDAYCEWSTVVDAPVTNIIMLTELIAYMKEEYGRSGIKDLQERIEVADQTGTSSRVSTKESLLSNNHAGKDGVWLCEEDVIKAYTPNAAKYACPVCGAKITASRSYEGTIVFIMNTASGKLVEEDYTECFTTIGCSASEDHEITDKLRHHVLDQITK